MRSLLGQGTKKLTHFTRRTGIKELRDRALADRERAANEATLTLEVCKPPKIMVVLDGARTRIPARAIEIRIPPAS